MDSGLTAESHIKVYVRFRPFNPQEIEQSQKVKPKPSSEWLHASSENSESVGVYFNSKQHLFTFDKVLSENADQLTVYNTGIHETVSEVMKGFNCSIFAYGQTSSGKTFTMEGSDVKGELRGVIPRAVESIFAEISSLQNHLESTSPPHPVETDDGQQLDCDTSSPIAIPNTTTLSGSNSSSSPPKATPRTRFRRAMSLPAIPRATVAAKQRVQNIAPGQVRFVVKLSMTELYMEKFNDLLAPVGGKPPPELKLRQHAKDGVVLEGATEVEGKDAATLLAAVSRGRRNRHAAATQMNERSSRGHMVVTLAVTRCEGDGVRTSKLHMVDLAGSENVRTTKADGTRLDEARTINRSLSALTGVIRALTAPRPGHVPFRDSKLTMLLKESLGGSSRTSLIVNCSPSYHNRAETLSSLRFGARAKMVRLRAVEVEARRRGSSSTSREEVEGLRQELVRAQEQIQQLKAELVTRGSCDRDPANGMSTERTDVGGGAEGDSPEVADEMEEDVGGGGGGQEEGEQEEEKDEEEQEEEKGEKEDDVAGGGVSDELEDGEQARENENSETLKAEVEVDEATAGNGYRETEETEETMTVTLHTDQIEVQNSTQLQQQQQQQQGGVQQGDRLLLLHTASTTSPAGQKVPLRVQFRQLEKEDDVAGGGASDELEDGEQARENENSETLKAEVEVDEATAGNGYRETEETEETMTVTLHTDQIEVQNSTQLQQQQQQQQGGVQQGDRLLLLYTASTTSPAGQKVPLRVQFRQLEVQRRQVATLMVQRAVRNWLQMTPRPSRDFERRHAGATIPSLRKTVKEIRRGRRTRTLRERSRTNSGDLMVDVNYRNIRFFWK